MTPPRRGKSLSTIRRHKRALRKFIDASTDECDRSIAYAMETVLTWATDNTVGWAPPVKEAQCLANLLRKKLR